MRKLCPLALVLFPLGVAMFGFGCSNTKPSGPPPETDVVLNVPAMN